VSADEQAASTPFWTEKVSAGAAPGGQWLCKPTLPSCLPIKKVAAMVKQIGGPNVAKLPPLVITDAAPIVHAKGRIDLVAIVDAAWKQRSSAVLPIKGSKAWEVVGDGTAEDFRHIISRQQLVDVIGEDACIAMDEASDIGSAQGITRVYALRRTQAQGRFIGWHTDSSSRTVQVPLTDDDTCEGGHLIFAYADGTTTRFKRCAGAMLAHDGGYVHGVTQLVRGVRYGLFVIRWDDIA
jgi:hypothetical protein